MDWRRFITSGFILCLFMLGHSYATAQSIPDPEKLKSLNQAEVQIRKKEKDLQKKRDNINKDIKGLKKNLQKSARQINAYEQEVLGLQQRIKDSSARREALKAELGQDYQHMQSLFAALQRLERTPPPAAAATPDNVIQAAQASALMRALSQSLHQDSENLSHVLEALKQTEDEFITQKQALNHNRDKLNQSRKTLEKQVTRKRDLQNSIDADRKVLKTKADRLAKQSQDLTALIENFESAVAAITPRIKPRKDGKENKAATKRQSRQAKAVDLPKGVSKFAKAKGKVRRPITGTLLRGYGNGHTGLTYKGQAGGQVLAPYAGRIEFAGAFKNYQKVVILNVGDGYFILLTGLGDTFAQAGDTVNVAEPIGSLPNSAPSDPPLFIELRKNGQPLNPVPWLMPRGVKSG